MNHYVLVKLMQASHSLMYLSTTFLHDQPNVLRKQMFGLLAFVWLTLAPIDFAFGAVIIIIIINNNINIRAVKLTH